MAHQSEKAKEEIAEAPSAAAQLGRSKEQYCENPISTSTVWGTTFVQSNKRFDKSTHTNCNKNITKLEYFAQHMFSGRRSLGWSLLAFLLTKRFWELYKVRN